MRQLGWLAGVLLLAGCGESTEWRSDPPTDHPVAPVPDREKEFADVPVPRDFTREEKSWAFEKGTMRMCKLAYTGVLDPFRTIEFMKQQMEIAGWKLEDKTLDGDTKLLNFSKANDRCHIIVTRADKKTRLTVAIDPKSAGGVSGE